MINLKIIDQVKALTSPSCKPLQGSWSRTGMMAENGQIDCFAV